MSERAFDAALGRRLRELRERQDLTCEQVALELKRYGVETSRVTVWNTENGRRSIKGYELTVFPRVLGVSLAELLVGLPVPDPVEVGPDEATVKAARRLDTDPTTVDELALRLWGRTLTAERDARVGAVGRSRTGQTLRGRVTRTLIDELRTSLPERPVGSEETTT